MIGGMHDASTWAPGLLLLFAAAATYIWRGLGTMLAARIDPESNLFQWIACVAYGLLAGLIGRILVFPVGILEQTQMIDRIGTLAVGFVLFFLTRRNIAVGTLGTGAMFMAVLYFRTRGG